MSIFRLTISAGALLCLFVSGQQVHAQHFTTQPSASIFVQPGTGCESNSSPCNRQCNTGCGAGFGCNRSCMSADQLWAGYSANTNCKGCVRRHALRPHLQGFGGAPACNLQACTSQCRPGMTLPGISVNWPRPFHLPAANCNSLRPKLHDVFNVFGCGKQKNVRCDIPNDCFGRLGESQDGPSQFQDLPSATESAPTIAPTPETHQENPTIPPAPVVEPVSDAPNSTSDRSAAPDYFRGFSR